MPFSRFCEGFFFYFGVVVRVLLAVLRWFHYFFSAHAGPAGHETHVAVYDLSSPSPMSMSSGARLSLFVCQAESNWGRDAIILKFSFQENDSFLSPSIRHYNGFWVVFWLEGLDLSKTLWFKRTEACVRVKSAMVGRWQFLKSIVRWRTAFKCVMNISQEARSSSHTM